MLTSAETKVVSTSITVDRCPTMAKFSSRTVKEMCTPLCKEIVAEATRFSGLLYVNGILAIITCILILFVAFGYAAVYRDIERLAYFNHHVRRHVSYRSSGDVVDGDV